MRHFSTYSMLQLEIMKVESWHCSMPWARASHVREQNNYSSTNRTKETQFASRCARCISMVILPIWEGLLLLLLLGVHVGLQLNYKSWHTRKQNDENGSGFFVGKSCSYTTHMNVYNVLWRLSEKLYIYVPGEQDWDYTIDPSPTILFPSSYL